MKIIRSITLAITLSFLTLPAQASTIYQYVGEFYDGFMDADNPFGAFDGTMRLTGYVILTGAVSQAPGVDITSQILDFSFDDGRSTYDMTNSVLAAASLQADSMGNIIDADFLGQSNLQLSPGDYFSQFSIGRQSIAETSPRVLPRYHGRLS